MDDELGPVVGHDLDGRRNGAGGVDHQRVTGLEELRQEAEGAGDERPVALGGDQHADGIAGQPRASGGSDASSAAGRS